MHESSTPGLPSSGRWHAVDVIVAAYAAWSGLLIARYASDSTAGAALVAVHAAIILTMFMIPVRGAAWEARAPATASGRALHGFTRFVRYAYPLPLALFFFEEGAFTVNMIHPDAPYWFEPRLYAADIAIFGASPARLLAPWVRPGLTEVMSFFYFSYYVILIGGVALAYVGPVRSRRVEVRRFPAAGFDEVLLALTVAFLAAFSAYPWIAARGPWENAALVADMPALDGYLFTHLMDRIIAHGAVSGNCFPSGHVAGAWAVVFGLALAPGHRRAVAVGVVLATGMSVACVYTRYHHAVDVPAGFACAVLGALAAVVLRSATRKRR